MNEKQRTLNKSFSISGIGLHSGQKVKVTVEPAPENHGYKFQRTDIEGKPIIPADASLVVDTQGGTALEKNGVKVCTTEHLLAALYGMQIDNALIKLDAVEIPIDSYAEIISVGLARVKKDPGELKDLGLNSD